MNLWGRLLKWCGWTVDITAPRRNKCVICVAPHTSNWDFLIGISAYKSLGREANFLMKKFWFFFPLKYVLRSLGGIPVVRGKNAGGLTESIIETFNTRSYMNLAVTPEGTRSKRSNWHTGFLRIAYGANVPLQLGIIDYKNKRVIIKEELPLCGDLEKDMTSVKNFYAHYADVAKYPSLFTT